MSEAPKKTFYKFVGIAHADANSEGFATLRRVKQPEGFYPTKAEAKQAIREEAPSIPNNDAPKFDGLTPREGGGVVGGVKAVASEPEEPKVFKLEIDSLPRPDAEVQTNKPYTVFIDPQTKAKTYAAKGWAVEGFQRYGNGQLVRVKITHHDGQAGHACVMAKGITYPSFVSGPTKSDLSWLIRAVMSGERDL